MVWTMFITIATISIATVSKTMALTAKHGAWIPQLITAAIYGIFAAIIVRLGVMHEGKTILEYSRDIAGRFVPYLLGLFYLCYFFIFFQYVCFFFDDLITTNFLIRTPVWALLIAGMPIYGYIAYKGWATAARLCEVVGVIFLIVAIIIFITMLVEGRVSYILPLYNHKQLGAYIVSVKDAVEQYAGVEILLFIPLTRRNKKPSVLAFLTMLGLGLFFVLDIYGCYAVLGADEIIYHKFPLIDALRIVEYQSLEILQRIDVAYETIGYMRVFLAKGIVYLVIVEIFCKLFSRVRRLTAVILIGVVTTAAILAIRNITGIHRILVICLSFGSVAAAFVIPCLLLMKARGMQNEKKKTNS
jgi:hypothetical protein